MNALTQQLAAYLTYIKGSSDSDRLMMRSTALAATVLVLAVVAASGGVLGAAARPVASQGGGSVVVAVEFTGTNSSAQPSNCTYGNNDREKPPKLNPFNRVIVHLFTQLKENNTGSS